MKYVTIFGFASQEKKTDTQNKINYQKEKAVESRWDKEFNYDRDDDTDECKGKERRRLYNKKSSV